MTEGMQQDAINVATKEIIQEKFVLMKLKKCLKNPLLIRKKCKNHF